MIALGLAIWLGLNVAFVAIAVAIGYRKSA